MTSGGASRSSPAGSGSARSWPRNWRLAAPTWRSPIASRAPKPNRRRRRSVLRGGRAVVLQADLAKPEDCERLIAETVEEFGAPDVLVNMASVYGSTPLADLTAEAWDRDLNINRDIGLSLRQGREYHTAARWRGRIVNFTDWLARSGRPAYPGFVSYYVAKAGVIALTEALALEVARDQILRQCDRHRSILPPPDLSDAESNDVAAATPVGRWGAHSRLPAR